MKFFCKELLSHRSNYVKITEKIQVQIMLSRVYCASTVGVDAKIIDVETHHTNCGWNSEHVRTASHR